MDSTEKQLQELRKRWRAAKAEGNTFLMEVIERRADAIKNSSPRAIRDREQRGKSHEEILADADAHVVKVKQQLTDLGFFEELERRYPIIKVSKRIKKIYA